jgi:hypothetical protein
MFINQSSYIGNQDPLNENNAEEEMDYLDYESSYKEVEPIKVEKEIQVEKEPNYLMLRIVNYKYFYLFGILLLLLFLLFLYFQNVVWELTPNEELNLTISYVLQNLK